MILFDLFSDILDFAQALIIDIPLNNDLSYLYVIINTVLSLLMTLFTGDPGTDGGIFSFF